VPRYIALRIIVVIYALGALLGLVAAGWALFGPTPRDAMLQVIGVGLGVALLFGSIAQSVMVVLDIEENTRRSADALELLAADMVRRQLPPATAPGAPPAAA
jgi:hypothetical protein